MLTAINVEGLEIQNDIKWLETFQKDLQSGCNLLLMAGVEPHVLEIFKKTGFSDLTGEENAFWPNRGDGTFLDKAYDATSRWLEGSNKMVNSAAEDIVG
jgi:hypothetical protein